MITAPAVITNPDLSNAQPSREGYVSLTIQMLAEGGTSESDVTPVAKIATFITDGACFLAQRALLQNSSSLTVFGLFQGHLTQRHSDTRSRHDWAALHFVWDYPLMSDYVVFIINWF